MSRVRLMMTMSEAVGVMSDGKPGPINVLMMLLTAGAVIDPRAGLGGFQYVAWLDDFGIYGDDIFRLYKTVCNCSLITMMALFRGWNVGTVTKATIHELLREGQPMTDEEITRLITGVREHVPDFDPVRKGTDRAPAPLGFTMSAR